MKHILLISILSVATGTAAAQFGITGTSVIEISVPQSMGYTSVYVVQDASSAVLSYTAARPGAQWERWGSRGAAFAEPVGAVTHDGNTSSIHAGAGDAGFRVTEADGVTVHYLWMVDYSQHRFSVSALGITDGSDCGRTALTVSGIADAIVAYSINGRPQTIDRDIQISYNTLTYDADSDSYVQVTRTESVESAGATISMPAPLCDTRFTMTPDRFSREWYPAIGDIDTPSFTAVAVEAHTSAEQVYVSAGNEQKTEGESDALGGSAPCEITFRAAVTDAAIFRRWEVSLTSDFADAELQYDQLEFTHTFSDAGTRYVRFTADNAAGSCAYDGDVYTVSIGESRLLCPNAFSPGASEGVNDEWRVSYRSIVSFECQIYNRWGKRMATLTHPSQGWDGKVSGKAVPAGVYFYTIKARGADGKEYKLSGDINVIGSRRSGATSPAE